MSMPPRARARARAALLVAVAVAVVALAVADSPAPCAKNGSECKAKSDCCSGCCASNECTPSPGFCTDPCKGQWCPKGSQCVQRKVQCFRAPCQTFAECE